MFNDAGYTHYEQEELYADYKNIILVIQRKSTGKRPDQALETAYKKGIRQRIEQVFSHITMCFFKKIHAVTEAGFLIKIMLFLLAYALEANL